MRAGGSAEVVAAVARGECRLQAAQGIGFCRSSAELVAAVASGERRLQAARGVGCLRGESASSVASPGRRHL